MITELIALLQNLPENPNWSVLLCPSSESARSYGQMLGVLLPTGAKFSGRTAQMGDGKRISVVSASDAVFIPQDVPYAVGLFGWGTAPTTEATKWLQRAVKLLNTNK